MKTYYSIVSIATKPQLNEKFNIGLLCVTPEQTFFHFSDAKFKIISKLLSTQGSKLALSALRGIDEKINPAILQASDMFQVGKLAMVSEPYLGYLSRYNNNLVQFSEPVTIDLKIDVDVFQTLFKKYIFAEESFQKIIKAKAPKFERVRKSFKESAQQYANIDFKVSNSIIKDLVAPVTVDVFGKNGEIVTGQSINFSKKASLLQRDIYSYMYLVEVMDKKAKSYVLGEEPSKKEELNHALWKNLHESKHIEFIPLDEYERIIAYMKKKGVEPVEV